MADITTKETLQLLSYVKDISRITPKLASAYLELSEDKAWIHLQRLVSTGYLEVKLEAPCSNPNCLGITDVSRLFKASTGTPVSFECHGCGLFVTIDLDDTNFCFVYQGLPALDDSVPTILKNQNNKTVMIGVIKGVVLMLFIVLFGLAAMLFIAVMIAFVLTI